MLGKQPHRPMWRRAVREDTNSNCTAEARIRAGEVAVDASLAGRETRACSNHCRGRIHHATKPGA
eukprot:12886240-Prorocentrum_lima.AAC.1